MKITVIIPSRARPFMLCDSIMSLNSLASGKHDVSYIVGCDSDDPDTAGTVELLKARGLPATPRVAPRPASLGRMVNGIALEVPGDVYCTLPDDAVCLTPAWDEMIHAAWLKRRDGVWWWRTRDNSRYAIISAKWHAAAGYLFTDYFPFWWDDVWLMQVWRYATGKPDLWIEAALDDRAPATQRMRDLEFWTDFYWSRADERRSEASRIRRTLGRPAFKLQPHHELRANPAYTQRTGEIEAKQGDRAPPTPEYLAAKARAESMMTERKAA